MMNDFTITDGLYEKLDESWHSFFNEELEKPHIEKMLRKVEKEYEDNICFPAIDDIFHAFEITPLKDIKVVILGQDPYHNDNQAHGLAFSVRKGEKLPPSLKNINKELEQEFGVQCIYDNQGDLSYWAKQGVFLLNTTLTVRAHHANSHSRIGWDAFTDDVIKYLDKQEQPMVFILWGAHAHRKHDLIKNPNHLVLKSAHPSSLSAKKGFFGNHHFLDANYWLEEHDVSPIQWIIPYCKD